MLNTLVGLVFRNIFIYKDLEDLYNKDLTYERKQQIKITLLKYPLKEAIVMIPRWVLGFPSTMIFANIFKETQLNEIKIDEKNYLSYGLMSKLLGIVIGFLICASFAFTYLAYIIKIDYLSSDNYIIYYIIVSVFLSYTFICISKTFISSVKKSLKEVEIVIENISNNNLTVNSVRITSDEIGRINKNIEIMADNLKGLVENIHKTATNVSKQADQLAVSSQESSVSIEEVTKTIDQLANGVIHQSENTESILNRLNQLGLKIENVQKITILVKSNNEKTKVLGEEGIEAVKNL
jgi:methyl-accepting chemotaxis protein